MKKISLVNKKEGIEMTKNIIIATLVLYAVLMTRFHTEADTFLENKELAKQAIVWALGDNWRSLKNYQIYDAWNKKHPDFLLTDQMDFKGTLVFLSQSYFMENKK